MAILLVVLIGVLGAVQFAAAETKVASVRQGALQLATQKVEYARNIPYQALGTKYADGTLGDPPGILPADGESVTTTAGAYTIAYRVWWMRKSDPDPAARTAMYKNINVTVSWVAPRPGSVSVETAIYGIDTDAATGDVQVFAQDVDTFAALQGVQVTLDPVSGPNRMVVTGSDGYSFFGHVPYGAITGLTAVKSGYMADYAVLGSKVVGPNVVNTWSVTMQRSKSAKIQVRNTSGPIQGASVTLLNQERGMSYGPFITDASGSTPPIPNLWNAIAAGYLATATYRGNSSSSTFSIGSLDTDVNSTIDFHDQAQITVTVKNSATGLALAGAAVGMTGPVNPVDDGSLTSGAGTKTFTVTQSGTYSITVSMAAYQPYTGSAVVDLNNASNPSAIMLVPVPVVVKLQVTVVDAFSPLTLFLLGRTVTVKNGSGTTVGSSTTNASGQIPLINIATGGTYTVTVAAVVAGNYQAFSGTKLINLTDPSPIMYTAATVTGRMQVQMRKPGGALPTTPSNYQVRIKLGNTNISSTSYEPATATAQFSLLKIGTYTVQVKVGNGGWANATVAPNGMLAITTGDSTLHSVVYSGAN